jgi:hypothetical protein
MQKISKNKFQSLTNIKNYSISQIQDLVKDNIHDTPPVYISKYMFNEIFKQIIKSDTMSLNIEDSLFLEHSMNQLFNIFDRYYTYIDLRDFVIGLCCFTNDKFDDKILTCWAMFSKNQEDMSISYQELIRVLTTIYKIAYLFSDKDLFKTFGMLPAELAGMTADKVLEYSDTLEISVDTFHLFMNDSTSLAILCRCVKQFISESLVETESQPESQPESQTESQTESQPESLVETESQPESQPESLTVKDIIHRLNTDNLQVCVLDIWYKHMTEMSQWRIATIIELDPHWNRLLIHYNGWDDRYNFWMSLDGQTSNIPNYKRIVFTDLITRPITHILDIVQFDFSNIPSNYIKNAPFSGKVSNNLQLNMLTDEQSLAQIKVINTYIYEPTRVEQPIQTTLTPLETTSITPLVITDIENQFKVIELLIASDDSITPDIRKNIVKIFTLINQFNSNVNGVIQYLENKSKHLLLLSQTNLDFVETVDSNESNIQLDWDYIERAELNVTDVREAPDAPDELLNAPDELLNAPDDVREAPDELLNEILDDILDEILEDPNIITELNPNSDPSYSNNCIYADLVYQLRGEQCDYDRVIKKPAHLRKFEYELIKSELETLYADKAFQLTGFQSDYDSVMEVALEMRKQRYLLIELYNNTFYATKALQLTGKQTDYNRVMEVSLSERESIFNKIESNFETYWADQAFQLRGLESDYSRVMLIDLPKRQSEFIVIQDEMNKTPTHRYSLRSRK